MKSRYVQTSENSIGFVGLLTIAFIVLKLTGFINWSWLFVLSPILLSICVGFLIFIFFLIYK